jgi:hypothetical protein
MNERMLELYKQAQVPYTAIDPSNNMPYETTAFSVNKFAELIVEECAMLVEGFLLDQEVALDEYVEYEASTVLKEHFGVKQ